MAENYLYPFANGENANVVDKDVWKAEAQRESGFKSGRATSSWFNYILGEGGAAAYVIGQLVADYSGKDAGIDAAALSANFRTALNAYISETFYKKSEVDALVKNSIASVPEEIDLGELS